MRRKDREMDRDFALQVLDKCEYAVLATVNPDGTPYCLSLIHIFVDHFSGFLINTALRFKTLSSK